MKKIGIENLVSWAFCNELPKAGMVEGGPASMVSGNAAFSEMLALGTIVDRSPNAYGVIPLFAYEGEPHADALRVGKAVRGLADRNFDIEQGWNPFPEWEDAHGLVVREVQRIVEDLVAGRDARLNGRHIVSLVTSCAALKRGPDWTVDAEPKAITFSRNGKNDAWFMMRREKVDGRMVEREVDGFDYKRRKPFANAYNKRRLSRSIIGDVFSRLDWQIWRSALETLHDELSSHLDSHELVPFQPDRQPWLKRGNSFSLEQVVEKAS